MLIFKFTKTKSAALVSHIDNLRAITYLIRRAGLDVQYSQGFNPHVELSFSPPIALGVESLAEYLSVKTEETANMLDRLNEASPVGIEFVRQFRCSVNVAAALNRARYLLQAKDIGKVVAEITSPDYAITYDERGKSVTKDVSSKIFAAESADANSAFVTLGIGNDNLRPDRLALHLMNKYDLQGDYRIVKLAAFADDVPADDYLASHSD